MPLPSELAADLDLTLTMQGLVQAWEEVYVAKMQRNRESVLQTRDFVEGIGRIFREVKLAYQSQAAALHLAGLGKTKGLVAVLLSTSEKLSGEINLKVFNKFWAYQLQHPEADLVIVGKLGKQRFTQYSGGSMSADHKQPRTSRAYRYFDLPEHAFGVEDLKPLVNYLLDYERVAVFHGKFQSFVSQQEIQSSISGQPEAGSGTDGASAEKLRFLFEPSPKAILTFFETQIFTALLKQTVHESYLAQIGSRIMTLEKTSSNVDEQLAKLALEKRKLNRRKHNRKQLRSLVGMSLW